MLFIAHRINTIAELEKVPCDFGVEVDIRDRNDRIILQHDPFCGGEDFEEYLERYRHKTLVLNVKSERIELRAIELLKKRGITDYFFLDSSFPMIYLLSKMGEKKVAVRHSEYEPASSALAMSGSAEWVWADCFTKFAIDADISTIFKNSGFKICLVSPELQGRPDDVEKYRDFVAGQNIKIDAVCSKLNNAGLWLRHLE